MERNRTKTEEREISCIFKVFDDIRQDCLALQIIALFQEIFERHKLGLQLFPYHTLPNRTGS
jgi:phosphatidylinositol 4-kinase